MPQFRDHVLDRIHETAKRIADLTAPGNPHRSPSTVSVVITEIDPLFCELELLCPIIKRVATNDKSKPCP